MRCRNKAKDNRTGLWIMCGGLILAILALVPIRALLLLCGMGLIILGALVFAGSRK
ncbi:MAG TPA: hypothetical protein GX701_04885 [Clostridiales bacterium]|jgi:hypothetical protein|nr:hypothetical protein [Clostridiales bacterium]